MRMTPIPNEEDFDEVEEMLEITRKKIVGHYHNEQYVNMKEIIREAMSWAIDQVIPEEKEEAKDIEKDIIKEPIKVLEGYVATGFNACIQEMVNTKKNLGL